MTDKMKLKILKRALDNIINPISFMAKEAEKSGWAMEPIYAMAVSNDANYLKGIASKALKEIGEVK